MPPGFARRVTPRLEKIPWTIATFLILVVESAGAQQPAGSKSQQPAGSKSQGTRGDSLTSARRLYRLQCADCHQSDGRGTEYRDDGISIPDFTSRMWVQKQSTTKLRMGILIGKGEEMPPFEDELNRQQANSLVALIRHFSGVELTKRSPKKSRQTKSVPLPGLTDFTTEWNRLTEQ